MFISFQVYLVIIMIFMTLVLLNNNKPETYSHNLNLNQVWKEMLQH